MKGRARWLAILGAVAWIALSAPAQTPDGPRLSIAPLADGKVRLAWTNAATGFVLEQTPELLANSIWSAVPKSPTAENGEFRLSLSLDVASQFFRLRFVPSDGLPSDPARVAPPPANGVATIVGDSTSFLYSGTNPVQFGVTPGTIDRKRAAVARGKVKSRDGRALGGVRMTILDHPVFGSTLTRADGMFDLAVNGGGPLTINYEKTGFCPVQRQVKVPWQDYVTVPDVVMIPMDSLVTPVALGSNSVMQVHQGSMQSDADGARKATLLFTPGTCGSFVLANGTTQNCSSISVRATEFTVGTNGPAAMPGVLPPTSGYTYAVELSADEAMVQGATTVQFDRPVFTYVENFIGFPVGTAVPVGFYDRQKAAWVPSLNGRVIKILGTTGGFGDVDTDGDGNADTGEGITNGERQQLATLYAAGQTLWRVPITHFTPWDCNWPYGPPDDATAPNGDVDSGQTLDGSCEIPANSIIECENQVLGESVAIVGTPHTLNYRSNRVPGRVANRTLNIKLSGASVPASLQSIELHLTVAGQTLNQTFAAAPNQQTTFVWDGLDAYGRPVEGEQLAVGSIDYVYPAVYKGPGASAAAFAQFGGSTITGNRQLSTVTISKQFSVGLGDLDPRTLGMGGWSLSGHHFYDPVGRVLHTGDGRRRRADSVGNIITTVAGNGTEGFSGDGGPATQAAFRSPQNVAVGPDGSLYIADPNNGRIRRVGPDGIITTVAGNGTGTFSGDGGPATQAALGAPFGVAVAPDGSLYIADFGNSRIRRVGPDGIITTVAGNGTQGFSGDGGPATQAALNSPFGVAVDPDGSLYIADRDNFRIRRVGPDGIITTVAGNGTFGFSGDGGPTTQAALKDPFNVAVGPDGSLYIADNSNFRIRRVRPDGIITTVAGNGTEGFSGDGGPATQAKLGQPRGVAVGPDGSLYIADAGDHRIRRVGPEGIITTVAGKGTQSFSGDGGPATQAAIANPPGVAVGPDGSLYIADISNLRIRAVTPPLPGFLTDIAIASEDGSLLDQFDSVGRHLRTLNALTGATLLEFGYGADGRLAQVIEKTGGTDNVTTIQHDGAGNPTAIVGPFGQSTMLGVDGNGFLSHLTNPAGEDTQFRSTPGGLLSTQTDPRGKTSTYLYDATGRLIHDADPIGGSQDLARTTTTNGFTVARTTALARTTTYKIENLPGNVQKRTVTAPDGTENQSTEVVDAGTTHVTSADGTISDTTLGPDPRFGMQSPIAANFSLQFPNTLEVTATTTRSVVLANSADPLSLVSLTQTTTVGGGTISNTYTSATRTIVTKTAAGRVHTVTLDALGRFAQGQIGNLDPVLVGFDTRSRLQSITNGSGLNARSVSLTYNAQGFLDTITDSIGRTAHLGYDAAGRVTSKTLPDGRVVSLGYDAVGNLTSVTPPGRPAYNLGYSDRHELTLFNPPAVPGSGPTAIAYDADGAVTNISRAGAQTISINYDAAGRPVTRKLNSGGGPATTDTFSYDTAGRTTNVIAASGVVFSYVYDGLLPIGVNWSGPVAGSVARTYDNSLRLASQSVNGVNTIAFNYDGDGLLTGAGDLAIVRDPRHGLGTGTTLGIVTSSLIFNGVGEMTNYTVTATASTIYSLSYVRDGIGRIAQKLETIGGVSDTFTYAYDTAGQLTNVVKNGATIESYAYDTNGNRTNATVGGVTVNATYDNQDRLTQSGTATFIYNAAGDLVSKTDGAQTTTFDYDPVGNLRGVILPDGTAISYLVDGLDRRVGRKVNGILVQAWLYDDLLRPVAELDGAVTVVSRFVYSGGSVPAYLINGGVSFRVITDQIRSVRLVLNASTGAIVQRMDYDSFGKVLLDTNPGFQPFGFAGGIYDPLTKVVRFGTRDYDPQTGHWTAQDSIWFGGNDPSLYRYCHNDPVNLLDPAGLDNWDAAQGFIEQMNEELQTALNPMLALNLLIDSAVKAAARQLGFDPGPTLREQMFRSLPTTADRKSEDYATGELAGVCVGVVGQLATGFIGEVAEAARLARLAEEAATLARQGRIAQRLASMEGRQASFDVLKAAAAEARNAGQRLEKAVEEEVVEVLKGWKTGGKGGRGSGRY